MVQAGANPNRHESGIEESDDEERLVRSGPDACRCSRLWRRALLAKRPSRSMNMRSATILGCRGSTICCQPPIGRPRRSPGRRPAGRPRLPRRPSLLRGRHVVHHEYLSRGPRRLSGSGGQDRRADDQRDDHLRQSGASARRRPDEARAMFVHRGRQRGTPSPKRRGHCAGGFRLRDESSRSRTTASRSRMSGRTPF